MAGSQGGQAIPTQLGRVQFEQFVLPHLSVGSRGPAPKRSLFKIFNYILRQLYMGCQWKELPIERDDGQNERNALVVRISRQGVNNLRELRGQIGSSLKTAEQIRLGPVS